MNIPEIFPDKDQLWDGDIFSISNSCSPKFKRDVVYMQSVPSYDEFFNKIFLKDQLCLLGSECTASWASRKLWVSAEGTPDFDFLCENFGKAKAPVTNYNVDKNECCQTEMVVSEFIDYWKKYQTDGHPLNNARLYLKDWHFTRDFPSFCAYSPPSLLCSDWLNEFWDVRQDEHQEDDYRFVYMGPKNTYTPFHSDVLRSYSWSANICGRKKWIFFPPGEEEKLRDRYGHLVADLRDPSLKDHVKFPLAEGVAEGGIVVIQNPGQIVFVPSGWHHQVYNLEDTISINHNWVNGTSIHLTWSFLKAQLTKVQYEINDCFGMDGFVNQCQKILKADSGMDYVELYNFVVTVAWHRLWALEAFCYLRGQHKGSVADIVPPSRSINETNATFSLCLWAAALYHSETLCAKSGLNKPAMEDIVMSANSSDTRVPTDLKLPTDSWNCHDHALCPHWAHCGPRLAVFDLQRCTVVLEDVILQPEWTAILIESESQSPLLEGLTTLKARIDEMCAQTVECLYL